MPTCLRAKVVYVPTCLHASVVYVSTFLVCQRGKSVLTFHFYVPINVPTCHKTCQYFNLAWRRAKSCARFLEHSSNEMLREISINTCIILIYLYYCIIFFILLFEKFHIIIDIIVIRIICICIVEKNCIILRFYTLYNIKEKSEEFFFFIAFVFFAL